jgi:predicted nucleotidyltransferase
MSPNSPNDLLHNLVYPDPERLPVLMSEIQYLLTQLVFVRHIFVFGSFARGSFDQWSDIDMIVVAETRQQFKAAFDHLDRHKPTLHHSPFVPLTEPCGGYILGNVFADESVFHCLDLNFLTLAEYQSAKALDRFGQLKVLYENPHAFVPAESVDDEILSIPETEAEKRISIAQHFTKKAIKKLLRKTGTRDELVQWSNQLKMVRHDHPDGLISVNGDVGWLADRYIEIADFLLEKQG